MDVLDNNGLDTQIAFIKAYVDKQIKAHASIPVGYEYFSMNPNVPQGSLPLLGGLYDRATYPDLWDWVQTQTGYCKTENEWQTLSAAQNGNVPFYSSGDGSTTFRVPSLKCWIKGKDGSETIGTYLDAGLPNIIGSFEASRYGYEPISSGAFTSKWPSGYTVYYMYPGSDGLYSKEIDLDASRFNQIYGNSSTVQPESIVGMRLVKAYSNIEDTGSINEQQYIDDRFIAAKDFAKQYTDTGISSVTVPTGMVQAYAGNTLPNGWLLCDGSAVSRTDYSDLFAAIGMVYGEGDGSTTFNLPNLTDKFIEGDVTAGNYKNAGLPNIVGEIYVSRYASTPTGSGSFYLGAQQSVTYLALGGDGVYTANLAFNARYYNTIYGNSNTVQPPALTMRYIIKY